MPGVRAQAALAAWQADRPRNSGSTKGLLVLTLHRLGNALPAPVARVYRVLYYVVVDCLLGISLPLEVPIGPGLSLLHGQGLVVSHRARIGEQVTMLHGVTIGERRKLAPTIEDRVSIGAHAVIIGGITIGHDSVIGAGAIVVEDVPPFSVVTGQKATIKPRTRFAADTPEPEPVSTPHP